MIGRPHRFLIFLMLGFFLPPLLLFTLGVSYPTSRTFIFVVPCTILVWFSARYDAIEKITETSNRLEILSGIAIFTLDVSYNVFRYCVLEIPSGPNDPGFGLIDMLIAFGSVCISLYGFRGTLKHFVLPITYLSILSGGYWVESRIPEMPFLQDSLASAMASMLNFFTITASTYGNVVTIHSSQGIISLSIDQDCVGLKSILAYGSLAVLMILDEKATKKSKVLSVIIGFVGTFLINILRLFTIFLAGYFFGVDAALSIHTYLGYGIFIVWIMMFWTIAFKYLLRPVED